MNAGRLFFFLLGLGFCCVLIAHAIWPLQENQQVIDPLTKSSEFHSEYRTAERRAEYSSRQFDENTWDMERLQYDLEASKMRDWPMKPALSEFPTPVPEYNNFGGSLSWPSMEMDGKVIKCSCIAWGKYDVNRHLASEDSHDMISYLNLFVLVDDLEPEKAAMAISSRNFPHILSTGKQETISGSIDWVHTGLADGNNYLLINQRVIDLNFGRTILVAPQKDGSLRMMQLKSRPSFQESKKKEFHDEIIQKLKTDSKVFEFFTNAGTIETKRE